MSLFNRVFVLGWKFDAVSRMVGLVLSPEVSWITPAEWFIAVSCCYQGALFPSVSCIAARTRIIWISCKYPIWCTLNPGSALKWTSECFSRYYDTGSARGKMPHRFLEAERETELPDHKSNDMESFSRDWDLDPSTQQNKKDFCYKSAASKLWWFDIRLKPHAPP